MIVHRIEAKLFGCAGIDEKRAGPYRRLGVFEHGAPVFISNHFGEHFLLVADAQGEQWRLFAGAVAAGFGNGRADFAAEPGQFVIRNVEFSSIAARLSGADK